MEIEYVIIDNKKYGIIREIKCNDIIYVFLTNLEDPEDQLIRKYSTRNPDNLLPLETDAEVDFSLKLFNEQ